MVRMQLPAELRDVQVVGPVSSLIKLHYEVWIQRRTGNGFFCLGCCWILMGLLFVLGVMNLLWIAALAAFVLVEKVAPSGHWVTRLTGLLLIGWGASMIAGLLS